MELILHRFRGHPEARFELEVFDGEAGSSGQATVLTEEYKREAAELVRSTGRTATAVAAEIGVHPTLLCRWVRRYALAGGKVGGGAARVFLSQAPAHRDRDKSRRKNAGQPAVAHTPEILMLSSSAANQNAGGPEIGIPAFILTLVTVSNAF